MKSKWLLLSRLCAEFLRRLVGPRSYPGMTLPPRKAVLATLGTCLTATYLIGKAEVHDARACNRSYARRTRTGISVVFRKMGSVLPVRIARPQPGCACNGRWVAVRRERRFRYPRDRSPGAGDCHAARARSSAPTDRPRLSRIPTCSVSGSGQEMARSHLHSAR